MIASAYLIFPFAETFHKIDRSSSLLQVSTTPTPTYQPLNGFTHTKKKIPYYSNTLKGFNKVSEHVIFFLHAIVRIDSLRN